MPDPIAIAGAIVLALLVSGAIAGIAGRRGTLAAELGRVVAIGAGFYLGCGWLGIVPRWSIREDMDRLLILVMPAVLIVEIVGALPGTPRWLVRAGRLVVVGFGTPVLLRGSVYLSMTWTPSFAAFVFLAIAVVEAIGWILLARRGTDVSLSIAMAMIIGAASLSIALSGYLGAGEAGMVLSASVLGGAVARSRSVGVAVIGLASLLTIGHFFGGLRADHAAILAAAPMLAWAPEAPGLRRLPATARATLRTALVATIAAGVIADAGRRFVEAGGFAVAAGAQGP